MSAFDDAMLFHGPPNEPVPFADRVTCPLCWGDGVVRGSSTECPACEGTGEVTADEAHDIKEQW